MDYKVAKKTLQTDLVKSFSKTKFRNAQLRLKSILWAKNLPSGTKQFPHESNYHVIHSGSIIKFGKPGKEVFRKNPNLNDMKPLLYEKRGANLVQSTKPFDFEQIANEFKIKLDKDETTSHILFTMLYRCGILDDHKYIDDVFSYNPDTQVMKWLDACFENVGETPPSELIAIYDAIGLNEDVKYYTNPQRERDFLNPYRALGRMNTMGSIFAACTNEKTLSRISLFDSLVKGRGTVRIFSRTYDYGQKIISPMTGYIVDFHDIQHKLII